MQPINRFDTTNSLEDIISSNPTLRDYKKQAKILHKKLKEQGPSTTLPLTQCHDIVAQQHGYKHWHEFHTNIKNLYASNLNKANAHYVVGNALPPSPSIHFGYNGQLGMNLWFEKEVLVNHTYIDGGNRTAFETHLAKQLIKNGEHLLFLSGEYASGQLKEIESYAKECGREADIRKLSFMTNGVRDNNWFFPENLPCGSGSLTGFLIKILLSSRGLEQNMDSAIHLASAVSMALTYMRDNGEIILGFGIIREYFLFANLVLLSKRRDFPVHIKNALNSYLQSIKGYDPSASKQSDTTLEQHGHLQMQFTKALSIFNDSYSYLFKGGRKTEDAIQILNELNNNNPVSHKLIFIVEFPDFLRSVEGFEVLSHFLTWVLRGNIISTLIISTLGLLYEKNPKEPRSFIFIKSCPLPKGFATMPALLRSRDNALILSYESLPPTDENLSLQANCNIKVNSNEDTYEIQFKNITANVKL